MVEYKSGIFHDKNWEEEIGTYQDAVIPDKDTAVAIASQIYKSMKKMISHKITFHKQFSTMKKTKYGSSHFGRVPIL